MSDETFDYWEWAASAPKCLGCGHAFDPKNAAHCHSPDLDRWCCSSCAKNNREAKCLDCGLDYKQFPLDVLLPRAQWLAIHPDENGVLCVACLVKRCALLPGAVVVHAVVEIAPHRRSTR